MQRFEKGNKFGKGRIPGSRNQTTLWLDLLGHKTLENVIRKVGEKAENGNMRAASLVLDRASPRRRGAPVEIDLPAVDTAAGVAKAQAALVACLARGEVTPEEAAAISGLLENRRRAIESEELERRIEQLENKTKVGTSVADTRGEP